VASKALRWVPWICGALHLRSDHSRSTDCDRATDACCCSFDAYSCAAKGTASSCAYRPTHGSEEASADGKHAPWIRRRSSYHPQITTACSSQSSWGSSSRCSQGSSAAAHHGERGSGWRDEDVAAEARGSGGKTACHGAAPPGALPARPAAHGPRHLAGRGAASHDRVVPIRSLVEEHAA